MKLVHLGILQEEKNPPDSRTPFTPTQVQTLLKTHSQLRIYVQSSNIRCFSDQEYRVLEIPVVEDMSHCDILFGVKEVPKERLLSDKTYVFFSHTTKKQPYNRLLLQEILRKRIRFIDYEHLSNECGQRQVAFGRHAGTVGAHNTLLAYGLKTGAYNLPRAKDCANYQALFSAYEKVRIPPMRVVLTGGGRAAEGAKKVLYAAGFTSLAPQDFLLTSEVQTPIYTQLHSLDYHKKTDGSPATLEEFYLHPQNFVSTFLPFTKKADILIAASYWKPEAPVLFTPEDTLAQDFSIQVIGDITCDIEGSIPCTKRASTIEQPLYNYVPSNGSIRDFEPKTSDITVMAVDNLPCELPVDASKDFGEQLMRHLMPQLLYNSTHTMIERATLTENGSLKEAFMYLEDWVR